MAIIENKAHQTITIQTAHTAYQMQADAYGYLIHLYYGPRLEDDTAYLIAHTGNALTLNPGEAALEDTSYSAGTLPQEYPTWGTGDFRTSCLKVSHVNGSSAADLRYVSHRILKGKYHLPGLPAVYAGEEEAETLEVTLADKGSGIRVILLYGVLPAYDIITRSVRIENSGNETETLLKADSACLDFLYGSWDMLHFSGKHAGERQLQRTPWMKGVRSVCSRRGTSSHQQNPFMIAADPAADEDHGSCYGMALMWSGGFLAEMDGDEFDQTRAVIGAYSEAFAWQLKPGESFTAPEAILAYSADGLTGLTHLYHRVIREHVCRGKWKLERRPVLINDWEAAMFDFDHDKLVSIARQAVDLGAELFVLDDGWFSTRNDDLHGLGDWNVNETKLPGGMKRLADDIHALGMKFGLWWEPEMVNEDTQLFRSHPEWVLSEPGRLPHRGRHQLVLDFSRKDVVDYIFDQMCAVLDSAPIEYIKWDMNRSLADVYSHSLPPEEQGETAFRYVLGVYDLAERLNQRYPEMLIEGCSGGGGRFDAGMMYYEPQIWLSDNSDAIDRILIQYGSSFGYPVACMGAHVSAVPNQQTGRTVPFNTRAIVAMSGTFGFELDLNLISDEEKEDARNSIELFKRFWNVIQNGNLYRLTDPKGPEELAGWMFVSPDQNEALLNVVPLAVHGNAFTRYLHLKGLDESKTYHLEETLFSGGAPWWMNPAKEPGMDGMEISGGALMHAGIRLPMFWDAYGCWQIHLTAENK